MAFGPMMTVTTKQGLELELAPFARDELRPFVEGFARGTVTQYFAEHRAQTLETEQAWYDKTIADKESIVWGIWAKDGETRRLIGGTSLVSITRKHVHTAISGIIIVDKNYWGKGVASASHHARTWYAFENLGLHCIKSAVVQGNVASLRALQRCGYTHIYTERNALSMASCTIPTTLSVSTPSTGPGTSGGGATNPRPSTQQLASTASPH